MMPLAATPVVNIAPVVLSGPATISAAAAGCSSHARSADSAAGREGEVEAAAAANRLRDDGVRAIAGC